MLNWVLYSVEFGPKSSQSDDSLNPSWEKVIDDYRGDLSDIDLFEFVSRFDSNHLEDVTLASPLIDSKIRDVIVLLRKTLFVGIVVEPGLLNVE